MGTRYRPTAGEKPPWKRGIKYHRFLSPLFSDEETETSGELDHRNYTPSKAHSIFNARPASFPSIGLEGDTGDDGKMEFAGGRSRTAVIYEQQGWESRRET